MSACPTCGVENPAGFRFCGGCGAPLALSSAGTERRKLATVVFCDLVDSTRLVEQRDPEAVRRRLGELFDELRAILERHGGTVEKFIGDAVMAVFGVPVTREDDALRALRAAEDLRAAASSHGLDVRIGVASGEVVAGTGETLLTGDAVNVAARLEQAAAAGEILVSEPTLRLVPAAVTAEPAGRRSLKGKNQPLETFRLIGVDPSAEPVARRLDVPIVGRQEELATILSAFERAVAARRRELVTVLGEPGVGKSRLAGEAIARLSDRAGVVEGRCLPYGEGITFWPLVEVLKQLGPEANAVLDALEAARGSTHELFWSVRKLFERTAADRPLVVVFDDVQWAEPTFLDLVEHVALLSANAPLLLLCLARPELLDRRPDWSATIRLEPLDESERAELIASFLGGEHVDERLQARIARASGGNPLFVEQMLAMVRDDGDDVAVPPTIQALLEARLDALATEERRVVDRGAVEGEVFHRRPVSALLETDEPIDGRLFGLVRKDVIRPAPPTFPDDDAFRFRHLLLRDAAYGALAKSTRAELHERFADWLEARPGRLLEHHEIVGYHLEQARRYRAELEPDDPRLPELDRRAGAHLAAAARAALRRVDWRSAHSLAVRAFELLPPDDPDRLGTLPPLAWRAMSAGAFELARSAVDELARSRDRRARAYALVLSFDVEATTTGAATAGATRAIDEAWRIFAELDDDSGLAYTARAEGFMAWLRCRAADAAEAWERSLVHADRAGDVTISDELRGMLASALAHGPDPVDVVLPRLTTMMLATAQDRPFVAAGIKRALALVHAMQGDVDIARSLLREGVEPHREAGLVALAACIHSQGGAFVERRAGDADAAERLLREGLAELERIGDHGYLATVAIDLASLVYERGSYDEARALWALARERSSPDDLVNVAFLDALEACLLARDGAIDEAEAVSLRAEHVAETSDFYGVRAGVQRYRAEVLAAAGQPAAAAAAAARAVALYEEKGDVVAARAVREKLLLQAEL